jgi:hypothetical protein
LDWPIIALLSLTGVVMGLVTSLVGLPIEAELGAWGVFFAGWVPVLLWRQPTSPVGTASAAGTLAGIWAAVVQLLLLEHYTASNPWYATELAATPVELAPVMALQGVVIGVLYGSLAGAAMMGIDIWRRRGTQPSDAP